MTAPAIPERLKRLPELGTDLWWTWNTQAREVFRKLDYTLWRQTAHNPVLMLRQVSQELLNVMAADDKFLGVYDAAIEALDAARSARDTWWAHRYPDVAGPIAYFSAEFALHQSLPIYAGGLGVLAGDHCKEASDLGIPLIGVGFMYPQGYFHQSVSPEGWQQESYERLNWADAPIEPAATPEGKPCVIAVPLGNRSVLVSVWRVRLGRVKLYLLDTDLEENAPWDRELSARLYGGDRETRVQQEIILGIGGVRALKAMGIGADGVAPQRRARRVRRAAAHPRSDRARRHLRVGARGGAPHDGLHDPHPRPGRPRRLSVQPGRDASRRRVGHARGLPRCVHGARALRQRQRPALQHDRAGAAHRRIRQRRQPAPRPGDARHVGTDLAGRRRRGAPGARDHQRRAHADVAVAAR